MTDVLLLLDYRHPQTLREAPELREEIGVERRYVLFFDVDYYKL